MHLLVTVTGLAPGASLDAAVALADALDARRVPATLLAGPRPHPEVARFTAARRRAGDAVLLHGTRPVPDAGRPYRRLPAHEAGLRLAGALRSAEALGLGVDGFAAPGWICSDGMRRALAVAGLDLLLDADGVHRLAGDGTTAATVPGAVRLPGVAPARVRRAVLRRGAAPTALHHVTVDLTDAASGAPRVALVDTVDAALAAGALPAAVTDLLGRPAPRPAPTVPGDPERWSITA